MGGLRGLTYGKFADFFKKGTPLKNGSLKVHIEVVC